ncbi:uncharacterized protein LOC144422131 [Styela clava]
MKSTTVLECLSRLFCLFGFPSFVHSDRGGSFSSHEFKSFLHFRGVSTSRTTPYHPTGNAQCERMNQTLRRTVKLILKDKGLKDPQWECVLPEAPHAVRSFLCTPVNATPHELFLKFSRKSMLGKALPTWLVTPGPVLVRKFVRNKDDPLCEEVDLLDANPNFASIKYKDGRESTVSTQDLALLGCTDKVSLYDESNKSKGVVIPIEQNIESEEVQNTEIKNQPSTFEAEMTQVPVPSSVGRPTRMRKPPERYGDWEYNC